jgi:hypothetical protein
MGASFTAGLVWAICAITIMHDKDHVVAERKLRCDQLEASYRARLRTPMQTEPYTTTRHTFSFLTWRQTTRTSLLMNVE